MGKDRGADLNQRTIEHPTDVEDGNDEYEESEMFNNLNASPDIKLKSIEIDDNFSANRNKSNAKFAEAGDDGSGTGHKVSNTRTTSKTGKSSLILQNSYGSETNSGTMKNQRDRALMVVNKMKTLFTKFKTD